MIKNNYTKEENYRRYKLATIMGISSRIISPYYNLIRKCNGCGRVFIVKHLTRKWCPECREEKGRIRRYDRMKKYPVIKCKHCGVMFQQTRRGNVFCTQRCAMNYNRVQRRKKYGSLFNVNTGEPLTRGVKRCPECNRLFTINDNSQIFCSSECCAKSNLRVYKKGEFVRPPKPELGILICKECGEEFVPGHLGREFCSIDCRITFYTKLNNERFKERVDKGLVLGTTNIGSSRKPDFDKEAGIIAREKKRVLSGYPSSSRTRVTLDNSLSTSKWDFSTPEISIDEDVEDVKIVDVPKEKTYMENFDEYLELIESEWEDE